MPGRKQHDKVILKLRDIRREKGLSLQDLADKSGIGYQRVGRVERGETKVTIDMLSHLSKVLNVSLSQLLGEKDISNVEDGSTFKYSEADIDVLPDIYNELEKICKRHKLVANNSVKVSLATIIFKSVQAVRTNTQDMKEMVKAFFQGFDAILERLVLRKQL